MPCHAGEEHSIRLDLFGCRDAVDRIRVTRPNHQQYSVQIQIKSHCLFFSQNSIHILITYLSPLFCQSLLDLYKCFLYPLVILSR